MEPPDKQNCINFSAWIGDHCLTQSGEESHVWKKFAASVWQQLLLWWNPLHGLLTIYCEHQSVASTSCFYMALQNQRVAITMFWQENPIGVKVLLQNLWLSLHNSHKTWQVPQFQCLRKAIKHVVRPEISFLSSLDRWLSCSKSKTDFWYRYLRGITILRPQSKQPFQIESCKHLMK